VQSKTYANKRLLNLLLNSFAVRFQPMRSLQTLDIQHLEIKSHTLGQLVSLPYARAPGPDVPPGSDMLQLADAAVLDSRGQPGSSAMAEVKQHTHTRILPCYICFCLPCFYNCGAKRGGHTHASAFVHVHTFHNAHKRTQKADNLAQRGLQGACLGTQLILRV
jgi:hypothetical protein